MLRLLIAAVITLGASLALAAEPESTLNMKSDVASDNPQIDWAHAKPVASLSVTPWESPKSATSDATPKSLFMIRGKVLDAVTGKTLSEPTLLIAAGAPATIEMGSASGYMLKVVVEVSPDKTSASSTSELKYSGVVMNSTTTMFKL